MLNLCSGSMSNCLMKIVVVLALVFWVSTNVRSAIPCSDTTHPQKLHKISHRQFLDKYGKDDTATTVIEYFFSNRKRASKTIIFSSIGFGVGVALTAIFATGTTTAAIGAFFVTLPIIILSLAFLGRACSELAKFQEKSLSKS
jgi:hypothetical protein